MTNSKISERGRRSPKLARRYLSPNEVWEKRALRVERTISTTEELAQNYGINYLISVGYHIEGMNGKEIPRWLYTLIG
jgi:hypothetical protein